MGRSIIYRNITRYRNFLMIFYGFNRLTSRNKTQKRYGGILGNSRNSSGDIGFLFQVSFAFQLLDKILRRAYIFRAKEPGCIFERWRVAIFGYKTDDEVQNLSLPFSKGIFLLHLQ